MRLKFFQHPATLCVAGLMLVPSLASAQDKRMTLSCNFPSGETYDGEEWIKGNWVCKINAEKGNFLDYVSDGLNAMWHATDGFYEILYNRGGTVKRGGVQYNMLH